MDFRKIKLEEGQKYTVVFYDGLIGIVSMQITLVDYYVSNYAQYEECLHLEMKIGRRRYITEQVFMPNQPLLIINGAKKINFDSLYTIKETKDAVIKQSKILSQSMKWIECAYDQVKKEDVLFYSKGYEKLNA